jgi:hypothetical protein
LPAANRSAIVRADSPPDDRSSMRQLGFGLGLMLAILAAALGVARLLAWLTGARAGDVSVGSLWSAVSANSLVGLQSFIENMLSPALWPPVLWLLLIPAWLLFGLLAAILIALCRPRRRFG